MRIHHIASRADWEAASRSGSYTTSTRGRSLSEEGFIHAARREQVPAVFRRRYADAHEPLVLLTIDTDRLASPWSEDPVGDETYPHVHGPINTGAVVDVRPLDRKGATDSLASLFLKEMALRMGLAIGAMLMAFIGAEVVGGLTDNEYGELVGALVGLVLGAAAAFAILRRRG